MGNKNSGRRSHALQVDFSKVKFVAAEGYTDKELSEIFNVSVRTVHNWKKQFPIFFHSIKEGKLLANEKVKASLFQRACGYSHPDVHIVSYLGHVKTVPIIKHYPPDTMAGIYWMNNREPGEWKNRHDVGGSFTFKFSEEEVKDRGNRLRNLLEI